MFPKSLAIIGGGITGLAVAYRLLQRWPAAKVTVFEKESAVGQHQSGHNSGVLHAGLYYRPGSLKAQLAVSGIRRMKAFCQQHGIAHEICGKLVVAVTPEERSRLQELERRGRANGLQGLRWLDAAAMREIEPHVAGLAALHVPEEGIVDYPAVCRQLESLIVTAGGQVEKNAEVRRIDRAPSGWRIRDREVAYLINCAGLHCDRVLALTGERPSTRIIPFRGEYFRLAAEAEGLVRHLIYPVPDPKFPFLGVHFTRMIQGGVECGPNAVLATCREGYSITDFRAADVAETLRFPGFWRFLRRYPAMWTYELRRSLSRAEFCRSLQRLVPAIEERHLRAGFAGVRAQAMTPEGTLVEDFAIVQRPGAIHLLNAPSPGATAALAIADYLLDQIAR